MKNFNLSFVSMIFQNLHRKVVLQNETLQRTVSRKIHKRGFHDQPAAKQVPGMKKLMGVAVILVGFVVTFLSVLAFFLEDYSYSFQGTPIWPIVLGIGIMFLGTLVLRTNIKPAPPRKKSARTEVDEIVKNENRLSTQPGGCGACSIWRSGWNMPRQDSTFRLPSRRLTQRRQKRFESWHRRNWNTKRIFRELKLECHKMSEAPVKEGNQALHFKICQGRAGFKGIRF